MLLAFLPAAQAAQRDARSGVVEGRVFNGATGTALANAQVTLENTGKEILTDESGTFRFVSVPAGEVRLQVSYIGMRRQTTAFVMPEGGTVQREIELRIADSRGMATEVVEMSAFTVVTDREMSAQAVAMNEKRHAPNQKLVVAIDEFGDRGNENIGDFLSFLPGVSVVSSGLEPFEVSLRGLPSNTSGMMIDGAEIASTRDERSPNLRAVPMANLSRVEVTKVPTPDSPANGLGGTINLISKTGFEAKKPEFSYQLYGLFHSSTGISLKAGPKHHVPQNSYETKQPSFDFNYLHPVNRSFAITVGGARTWRMVPAVNSNDEIATWDIVANVQRAGTVSTLVQLNKTQSGQIGFDWKVGPNDTLSLSYHVREYQLPITRSTLVVNYGVGVTGDATFSQGAATGVGTVTQGQNWRVEGYRTDQLSTKYRHRGSTWKIDGNVSFSQSSEYARDVEEGMFRNASSATGSLILRGEGMPPSDGVIHRRYSARKRTGEVFDVYDGGGYTIPSGTSSPLQREATVINARVDVARDFSLRVPFTVKVGSAVSRNSYDLQSATKTWSFRPNGSSDADARMARNFDVFDEPVLAGIQVFGRPYREISLKKLYELSQAHPTWFVLDEPAAYQTKVTGSREYTETISAAYLRTDVRLFNSRLWLVGGVRFEQTSGEGSGPLDDINAQYQRDAKGGFLLNGAGQRLLITNDALELRKLRYRERGARSARTYDGYYPSINAVFNLSENLLLRGAYARTVGRPAANFITPGVTITAPEVPDPTITVSNPGLLPWTADNFDLTLESYNVKDGFGSVAIFQKNISNFFGTRRFGVTPQLLESYSIVDDGSFGNYQVVTRENVGDAKITGLEIGYRQSLTFLPVVARGFQIFVNMTKLRLGGSNAAEFTGFTPSTLSGGLNFIRGRFFIKTTYSYLGETRQSPVGVSTANGIPPGTYQYQGRQSRWNIDGEFSLNRRISIFATVMDIGGYDFKTLRYAPNTPDYAKGLRIMRMGSFTTLGIKGKF